MSDKKGDKNALKCMREGKEVGGGGGKRRRSGRW